MQNEINMLEEMIELLTDTRTDYSKFYNEGNSAAGTRLRKAAGRPVKSLPPIYTGEHSGKNSS